MKKRVLRFVAVTIGVYVFACGVVALAYKPFLFPAPHRAPVMPAGATKIEAGTATALRFGPDDAETAIVFFHGNGELADDGADLARSLASHGWAVYLAEYRGYGMSAGAGGPSERAIYDDAEAIVSSLRVKNDHLVLMGFSLGTGVATEMAARGHGRALVLLAPYTTIPAVAQRHAPIFPMGLLMRDRFDTLSKAPQIALPAFVAHGDRDEVVPFDMGETVAHAFPHGRFVTVPGATHMTMFERDDKLVAKIVDFVIEVTPI
jgi:pimeloyl-ACP methyl ester carboxylesterase